MIGCACERRSRRESLRNGNYRERSKVELEEQSKMLPRNSKKRQIILMSKLREVIRLNKKETKTGLLMRVSHH